MYDSQYGSIIEGSSVLTDARGYNEFGKMTGRGSPRYNYMSIHFQPDPLDARFEKINTDVNKRKIRTILPFDKDLGRDRIVNKKEMYSSPNYDPVYSLTKKKTSSVPIFGKLLGRKPNNKPNYCANDYELKKSD